MKPLTIAIVTVAMLFASPALAQAPAPQPKGAAKVRADAEKLLPLFPEGPARRFLEAARTEQAVPAVGTRQLLRNKESNEWLTWDEGLKLPDQKKMKFTPSACEEQFFYETRYGSPLVYARVLELAGRHGLALEPNDQHPPTLLDFGYGTIGHLMIAGAIGIETTGTDIDSMLLKVYAPEVAAGRIQRLGSNASVGIHLFEGRWPTDPKIINDVHKAAPEGFDIITSKNTLKEGYLHPTKPVEERKLVKTGLPDETFVQVVFNSIKPGGLFIIYNISPRPSREGEPYKPWADGRCPFPRELLERSGFEVLALDEIDDAKAEAIFKALGYPITDHKGEKDLFALYTVCRRPGK